MTRYCKSCRHLRGDKEKRVASCLFWPHFAATAPMPARGFPRPDFRPTLLTARLIWSDLPTPPELAALGHDHLAEDLTESMDCPTWEAVQ